MLRIATVNVNGLRGSTVNRERQGKSSFRRDWLANADVDVVTLQEVRCPDELVAELVPGHEIVHDEALDRGRAGVAVASRLPILDWRVGSHAAFRGKGRWIEADVKVGGRTPLTVISAYAHTGNEESPEKMKEKLAWFRAAERRLGELAEDGRHVLLTGDLNVAHTEADLKNWKGNLKKAGFLPEERTIFDRWFSDLGWVDVVRRLHPGEEGPYSWWSYRGHAFDTDAGWRIDYHIASPKLAAKAVSSWVDRAPSWAERWSDHAPVVVDYDLTAAR
jgi:exodeoxyribonuclease III